MVVEFITCLLNAFPLSDLLCDLPLSCERTWRHCPPKWSWIWILVDTIRTCNKIPSQGHIGRRVSGHVHTYIQCARTCRCNRMLKAAVTFPNRMVVAPPKVQQKPMRAKQGDATVGWDTMHTAKDVSKVGSVGGGGRGAVLTGEDMSSNVNVSQHQRASQHPCMCLLCTMAVGL